jgi:hypothetical protein
MEYKGSLSFSQKSALAISRRTLFLATPSSSLLLRFTLFLCCYLRLFLPRCVVRNCLLTHLYACLVKGIQHLHPCVKMCVNTGCPKRNVPNFGRVFLMLKYTDITQNTYTQSWKVREIMAREIWNFDSCYTLINYQTHIKTGRNMWFL